MTQTTQAIDKVAKVASYTDLLRAVRGAVARGRERAADAVEREKVRTFWEIGRLIHAHILLHKDRADYGKQVIKRLSADLAMSETELYYMVEFARTYPIFRLTGKLPWGHHQALLRINDADQRKELAEQASRQNWSQKKLRREIGKLKAAKQITTTDIPADELLIAKRGKLNTYKIVIAELGPFKGKPVIDLGFSNYHRPEGKFPFHENEIVKWNSNAGARLPRSKKSGETPPLQKAFAVTSNDLFTFQVYLDEVTDADTLWVLVDLGFGFTTKQQLRLRGIDAPEITTRDGQTAKRFVERQLKSASQVVITSTKSDKYDRYLADVFYTVKGKEKFLNNELLKRGLAVRVE